MTSLAIDDDTYEERQEEAEKHPALVAKEKAILLNELKRPNLDSIQQRVQNFTNWHRSELISTAEHAVILVTSFQGREHKLLIEEPSLPNIVQLLFDLPDASARSDYIDFFYDARSASIVGKEVLDAKKEAEKAEAAALKNADVAKLLAALQAQGVDVSTLKTSNELTLPTAPPMTQVVPGIPATTPPPNLIDIGGPIPPTTESAELTKVGEKRSQPEARSSLAETLGSLLGSTKTSRKTS